MTKQVDFFLASSEGYELDQPRDCRVESRLAMLNRDDWMLVTIDPPIVGQQYGQGGHDIDQVALAAKYDGDTLWPISRWPMFVRVLIPSDEWQVESGTVSDNMIEIAWAELYRSHEDAVSKVM